MDQSSDVWLEIWLGMNRGLNLAVITEENEDSGGVISEADIEVKFPDHKDDFLLEIEKRRPASIRNVIKRINSFDRNDTEIKLTQEVDVFMNKGKPIAVNDYHFLKTIGQGSFAEVKMVTKLEDDQKIYAMKLIKKHNAVRTFGARRATSDSSLSLEPPPPPSLVHSLSEGHATRRHKALCNLLSNNSLPAEVAKEIYILSQLTHPHLVKLIEIIDSADSPLLYLVMEYVEVGPVMTFNPVTKTFFCKLTNGVMLESFASKIFRDLMSAIAYLHSNHVAHRDVKPDNLLIDFHGNLKVSDFGVSSYFSNEKEKEFKSLRLLSHSASRGVVRKTEGTWSFYSPEMCQGESVSSHNAYMSDLWACAVCLWIFIFGVLPFQHENILILFEIIRTREPVMPHTVSPELSSLFEVLFRKNPLERLSIVDIQAHHWVQGTLPDRTEDEPLTPRQQFPPRILAKIRLWIARAKSRQTARVENFEKKSHTDIVELTNISLAQEEIALQEGPREQEQQGKSLNSFSDIMKMKKWAKVAKKAVATKKVKREKVGRNKKIINWKENAKLSVRTRRNKLEAKLTAVIRTMVEKTRSEVQKIQKKQTFNEDDEDGGDCSDESSDFCFSDDDSSLGSEIDEDA